MKKLLASPSAMAARLLFAMNHIIAITVLLAASIVAASATSFSTSTAGTINGNNLAFTAATGNSNSLAIFTNNLANAFATNSGGVWNFDGTSWSLNSGETVTLSYGTSQTSNLVLTFTAGGGESVGQGNPSSPTSGTTELTESGTAGDRVFTPNKPLVAVSIFNLSRGDSSRTAALKVTFLDGTTATTSGANGGAVYFHELEANPTNPIVKFAISQSNLNRYDDLGFIVGPPLPIPFVTNTVGVNFNGVDGSGINNARTTSLLPAESAGAPGFAQTNWNNLDRWGDLGSGIKDSKGTESGLHLQWDAAGVGSSGAYASLGTPNGKLMDGMNQTDWGGGPPAPLNQNNSTYGQPNSDKPAVYVRGLQAYMSARGWTNYSVVMYVNGWHWYGIAQHWIQAVTNGNEWSMGLGGILAGPLFNRDTGPFNGTFSQVSYNCTNAASASSGGNYIVFTHLTNDAILLCTGEPNADWQIGQLMGFQIVPSFNHLPVPGGSFTMGAVIGTPTSVRIIGGKWSPTDADNDPLTITGVTGAANGTVTTDGTNITYTATAGTTDSFTYTVSDGYGGTTNQTVSVAISSSASSQGFNQMSAQVISGNAHLTYLGIPGSKYALDWTHSLASPITWLPLVTNTAAGNGYLLFTNTPSGGADFYRTRHVP